MKSCPSCGAEAEDGARFCLECGHAFEDAPLADDPWSGRLVAGRYRLMDKLGEGGMGEVFRAEQLPMGRLVAVKTLRQSLADDSRAVERFKREAQAASQLVHPNTITVHDFGQDQDGTLFIAMELLSGEGLDGVLDREGPLPPERVVHVLSQVCGSLAEAHGRGLIHRDLKPENIMLSRIGDQPDFVKVLDFGIAKVTQSSRGERLETLTSAGAIFGTPQYMAPEQIRGDDIDARADVYALGVVLYQMIAGQLPFAASTVMEMLTKHLSAQPAPIARGAGTAESDEAYARLEAVALRALSKDPAQRQASARAFLEDLMAAMPQFALNPLTGLMPQAAPAGPVSVNVPALAPEGASSRSAGRVVFFTALVAALAGAAFFFLRVTPPSGGGGNAAPAVLAQAADEGGDGDEAPAEDPPAEDPPAQDPAAAGDDGGAENDADGAEADPPPADDKPMTDGEAKAAAAEAAAEEKAARDAAKAAEAEEKAKAAEEKAKTAEEKNKNAEVAKATAEAEKQAAEMAKKAAEAEKLQAQEAAAQAKAAAAQATADKAAAEAEAEKARKQREAIEVQRAAAEAAKAKAEAQAAAAKAEADTLKAQLQQIEDEKAAAAARAEEERVKAEEAKAKAQAAKKNQRPKIQFGAIKVTGPAGEKVLVNNRMRGKLPMSAPIKLKAGRYTVKVGGQTRTVNVAGGATASVRF